MSSRLASFRGPSTPSKVPVSQRQPNNPSSPARSLESTYHRKTRTSLQELKAVAHTWDELVLLDGAKAARSLIDTRTELDNALAQIPNRSPRSHVVGPKLAIMEKRILELDSVVEKLRKQFRKMNTTIDSLELTLFEAHKTKGWVFVATEPLWATWSLDKFVSTIPVMLTAYHRSLSMHSEIVEVLRNHDVSFEESRRAISKWVEQPHLVQEGWDARWEDLCTVEVERWEEVGK